MYKMNEIKTKVEYFSDIMQLPCHEGEYQVMAVMFDEICFGELKNNKYSFEKRDYLFSFLFLSCLIFFICLFMGGY